MNQINQINQLTSVNTLKLSHAAVQPKTDGSTFAGLMKEELNKTEGLRFSKHAAQRVQERGIEVSDRLMTDLNQAVEKAKAKGAKDGAFIVNVPHNLVVTTMNGTEMKENIFTNIDSAVLL